MNCRDAWDKAATWFRRFTAAKNGNVAMVVALTLVPLCVSVGAGIDMARQLVVRSRMMAALDAAGLAVGGAVNLSEEAMEELAQKYFDANYKADTSYGTPSAVNVEKSDTGPEITVSSHLSMPTTLLQAMGIGSIPVNAEIEVTHSSVNLEVALALDTTNSMSGSRMTDLKAAAKDLIDLVVQDVQTPTYSKVALVPYSMGVNVGSYANDIRGAIAAPKAITNASWATGTTKGITGATRANPVVITSNAHGFANGDKVYIKNVVGMTQINNKTFTVANATSNKFSLSGINGSSYNSYTSGGTVAKYDLVVTSSGHSFSNGEVIYITGVGGMTQLNNKAFTVANKTINTFMLSGIDGSTYTNYTSGGAAYCTAPGCEYFHFTNASSPSAQKTFRVSTCVTERTGDDAYLDTAPSTVPLGRNYPAPTNGCIAATITPLSTSKTGLKSDIDALSAGGSTGGHIGVAWAWYLLSPNFGYLWSESSRPAAYDAENVLKVAVIMTDGEYNSMYCNGVISKDATSGSGNTSDHISCNAPNGHAFDQAQAQCAAMKASGVIIYTVGFDVVEDPRAEALVNGCASDEDHIYLPSDGTELKLAFRAIAQDITALRLSR